MSRCADDYSHYPRNALGTTVEGVIDTSLAAGLRIRGLRRSYGPVTAVDGVDLVEALRTAESNGWL